MYHKFKQYPNSLRKHRKAAGLRQFEVARHLGLSNCERISKWENGRATPVLWTLFQLAALYRVSPQELYDDLYRQSIASVSDPSADTQAGGDVLPMLILRPTFRYETVVDALQYLAECYERLKCFFGEDLLRHRTKIT